LWPCRLTRKTKHDIEIDIDIDIDIETATECYFKNWTVTQLCLTKSVYLCRYLRRKPTADSDATLLGGAKIVEQKLITFSSKKIYFFNRCYAN
jgi:hypothetical protein